MEHTIGVAVNCQHLILREEPDRHANVVTAIPTLSEVAIDMEASTDRFYRVCTAAGVEGFCAKECIAIRR